MSQGKQFLNPQIDHIVIAGSDLDRLVADFTAFGLTPDAGGVHADGQTHNALIGFEDGSYLELIAPVPGREISHGWAAFMTENAGVCAWAIRSEDIQKDVVDYRTRGVTVADPRAGGRNRPDGVRVDWIVASMGDSVAIGSTLPFLIQDVTPRANRVPLTASASGFSGVAHVGVRQGSAELLKQALGTWDGYDITDQPGDGLYGVALRAKNLDEAAQRYQIKEVVTFMGHRVGVTALPHVNLFIIE
jgi:catechol 2,3-dioxygenase-like lactoylglutathione lyase family enzyme